MRNEAESPEAERIPSLGYTATPWRRGSESNGVCQLFRLQLTHLQRGNNPDFIGLQALFATIRSLPRNAPLPPLQRSVGEDSGEAFEGCDVRAVVPSPATGQIRQQTNATCVH
jgi:hypothetical protein